MVGIFLLSSTIACSTSDKETKLRYFNQKFPGSTPAIFAPSIISLPDQVEGSGIYSPEGKQFFFMKQNYFQTLSIMQMDLDGMQWSQPKKAVFSDKKYNWGPCPSPDGQHIYFISNRPPSLSDWFGKVWRSTKNEDGTWSSADLVKLPVYDNEGIWDPSISSSQQLYFGAKFEIQENHGESDIYTCNLLADSISFTNLGNSINSSAQESFPYIAADGSYLIFSSDRPGGSGNLDLYISYAEATGWTEPSNLGQKINSEAAEFAASVTPDGMFILFDRRVGNDQDIYWVSADVIDELKER